MPLINLKLVLIRKGANSLTRIIWYIIFADILIRHNSKQIDRNGDFIFHYWGCKLIYCPLSNPLRALYFLKNILNYY